MSAMIVNKKFGRVSWICPSGQYRVCRYTSLRLMVDINYYMLIRNNELYMLDSDLNMYIIGDNSCALLDKTGLRRQCHDGFVPYDTRLQPSDIPHEESGDNFHYLRNSAPGRTTHSCITFKGDGWDFTSTELGLCSKWYDAGKFWDAKDRDHEPFGIDLYSLDMDPIVISQSECGGPIKCTDIRNGLCLLIIMTNDDIVQYREFANISVYCIRSKRVIWTYSSEMVSVTPISSRFVADGVLHVHICKRKNIHHPYADHYVFVNMVDNTEYVITDVQTN